MSPTSSMPSALTSISSWPRAKAPIVSCPLSAVDTNRSGPRVPAPSQVSASP